MKKFFKKASTFLIFHYAQKVFTGFKIDFLEQARTKKILYNFIIQYRKQILSYLYFHIVCVNGKIKIIKLILGLKPI